MKVISEVREFRRRQARIRKNLRKYRRTRRPEHTWSVSELADGNVTTLEYGNQRLEFGILSPFAGLPEVRDHCALALAAISMSYNAQIEYSGPVSAGMANQIEVLSRAYRLWSISSLAPLRLNLSNVVDSQPTNSNVGLICLSGGLDSLHAALGAHFDGNVSHALLVAGLDYPDDTSPGFVELKKRVGTIARKFGFETLDAKSTINTDKFAWNQLHGFNLGACLNLFSESFGFGVFAQDNTSIQDLHRHPWGNNGVLAGLMSTDRFSIKTDGTSTDRVGKLRSIVEWDESILQNLSVCYVDKTTGGNCGACAKCCQMRAAFEAVGVSDKGIFQSYPDLADRFDQFEIPSNHTLLRGMMCRTTELVDALPDGRTRASLVRLEDRLRSKFVTMTPPD